jgi:hypothetical protein
LRGVSRLSPLVLCRRAPVDRGDSRLRCEIGCFSLARQAG